MARIVAFYSYKGGVGRSVCLANVAALLALKGKRVACIDFDLEAGGLHTIFGVEKDEIQCTLLDLISSLIVPDVGRALIDLTDKLPRNVGGGGLWLLPTISETNKVLAALDSGRDLMALLGRFIDTIVDRLNPHFIFIDSRSGFAELASAPILKASELVCVLRPNRQNAEGLRLLLDILSTFPSPPQTFLVLSQVPKLPETSARLEKLRQLLGSDRSFGTVVPYEPVLALEESVATLTLPDSEVAQSYLPVASWLEDGTS